MCTQKQRRHASLQVHLTFWSSTSVLVSWDTCDAVVGNSAAARSAAGVKSVVEYGTSSKHLHHTATSSPTSYVYDYQKAGKPSYASPLLHHVLLKGDTRCSQQCQWLRNPGGPQTLHISTSCVHRWICTSNLYQTPDELVCSPGSMPKVVKPHHLPGSQCCFLVDL